MAEQEDHHSIVQHAVEKDSTDSIERESESAIEATETLSEVQSEYFGCEVASEPCEECACVEERDRVDEIPETLEVSWLETLPVGTGENEDSQQEPVTTNAEPNYVITSP